MLLFRTGGKRVLFLIVNKIRSHRLSASRKLLKLDSKHKLLHASLL